MSRVVHFEVMCDDVDRAVKFYETVFGWKFNKWDGPIEYWLVDTGDKDQPGINGGFMKREKSGGGTVCNTIDVASVDSYIAKIKQAGGEIEVDKAAVPGVGWFAYFKDPEGNVFGIMEEDSSAK